MAITLKQYVQKHVQTKLKLVDVLLSSRRLDLLHVPDDLQSFSGSKAAHGHVIFGAGARGQRVHAGRMAQGLVLGYWHTGKRRVH